MTENRPIIVTCGLPYANGMAHLGHMRTYIPADIFVRSLKKSGRQTIFVCGSDTHGTPIVVNAEQAGLTPKQLVSRYNEHFAGIFSRMEIDFDNYGTTDDEENHIRTTDIVQKNIDGGHIFSKKIEVAYCPKCNRFLPDRYVEGICAHCGAVARGDECDQGCGKPLEPGELLNPVCAVCKTPAEYREQEHYFFRLSDFTKDIAEFLDNVKGTDNAVNYAKGWLSQGLKDWCITRNLEWGVRFPGSDDLVVYVWVDAPIGYIAFTEEYAAKNGLDWEKLWKNDSADIVHFIGGDIVYHHCIFWPAMLTGAGYSRPTGIVASGMVKIQDHKFSKSRGYVVWVGEDYLDQGFHPDLLRYYMASYTSHTKELNFSWKLFQEKINSELVGVLGNFFYRSLLFAFKNFGQIPEGTVDPSILEKIREVTAESGKALEEYEFKKYTDTLMELASYGNTYFQANEPWALIKTDREKCGQVLLNCIQIVKALCILFDPVTPGKMQEAWETISGKDLVADTPYEEAVVPVVPGTTIQKPEILFEKLDDDRIAVVDGIADMRVSAALEKAGLKPAADSKTADGKTAGGNAADKKAADGKGKDKKSDNSKGKDKMTEKEAAGENAQAEEKAPQITIDEFFRSQIRVGQILTAEHIEKSTKLFKLTVDVGEEEPRQIVSGLRAYYQGEDLVGKKVCVIVNLKPAKLCGVVSRGMILASDDGEGNVSLLTPDKDMKVGSEIC